MNFLHLMAEHNCKKHSLTLLIFHSRKFLFFSSLASIMNDKK